VLFPLLIVLAHVGAVHGGQGAPDLMRPVVAKDATLNNELDLTELRWVPGRDRRELALGFGVEKIVAKFKPYQIRSERGRLLRCSESFETLPGARSTPLKKPWRIKGIV
jgi:hypothetical protein